MKLNNCWQRINEIVNNNYDKFPIRFSWFLSKEGKEKL